MRKSECEGDWGDQERFVGKGINGMSSGLPRVSQFWPDPASQMTKPNPIESEFKSIFIIGNKQAQMLWQYPTVFTNILTLYKMSFTKRLVGRSSASSLCCTLFLQYHKILNICWKIDFQSKFVPSLSKLCWKFLSTQGTTSSSSKNFSHCCGFNSLFHTSQHHWQSQIVCTVVSFSATQKSQLAVNPKSWSWLRMS